MWSFAIQRFDGVRAENFVTESTPPPRPTSSFQQIPLSINTGSFANATEHRKHVDNVLKEKLGHLYVGVLGFFEAFFEDVPGLEQAAQTLFDKCKAGESALYLEKCWQARRRPLAQPHQPLQGSTADRKLDIGFLDDPNAGVDSTCQWSQIIIPGELKSEPSVDKVSEAWLELGRYAREVLAAQDSRRFILVRYRQNISLYSDSFVATLACRMESCSPSEKKDGLSYPSIPNAHSQSHKNA
ncbi:hypothetical protein BKA63DRAFT_414199 [Paraphoma chrysanthemicola]|nr:hypothetical protein BKA63DRAFT_414199 [Paraphoma chrysanthemicola]